MKVKIIGAGSIGNHHARACRTMGWDVDVVDSNFEALNRMRYEIYPKRYGEWDIEIRLFHFPLLLELKDKYDIIMIDTPPHVRINLAIEALKERPRLLHFEKPLCTPNLNGLSNFLPEHENGFSVAESGDCKLTVGYNHAVSKSVERVVEIIKSGALGEIITIDVEFREHWEGIFKAHPWLKRPEDSYLGDWRKGGGAGGEHSHALHLWLYLARVANLGAIAEVKSEFDVVDGKYDRVAAFILKTFYGNVGRVVQDVVTRPPRKWARVQGTKGFVEWHCNGAPKGGDIVTHEFSTGEIIDTIFPKNRELDFLYLMEHYKSLLSGKTNYNDSPLHIDYGIRVMDILHDAYYG